MRIAWGKAKRQVTALKSEIAALLSSDATLVEIYETLTHSGQLKTARSTFFRHAKAIRKELEDKAAASQRQPLEVTPKLQTWLKEAGEFAGESGQPSERLGAWLKDAKGLRQPQASNPPNEVKPQTAGHPVPQPRRMPIGAGVEPENPKFNHFKSGETNHWDEEEATRNRNQNMETRK